MWTPLQAAPLPCLDSGNDCLRTLTEAAIERSPELQTLDERIALCREHLLANVEARGEQHGALRLAVLPVGRCAGAR